MTSAHDHFVWMPLTMTAEEVAMTVFRRRPSWFAENARNYPTFPKPDTDGLYHAEAVKEWVDRRHDRVTYASSTALTAIAQHRALNGRRATETLAKPLKAEIPEHRLTVKQACEAYVAFLRAERKTADDTEKRFGKHVYAFRDSSKPDDPVLGETAIVDLTQTCLDAWKRAMVHRDPEDPEVERRSKDSANRVLTMLKAALNRAFLDDDNRIPSDTAWRKVKSFRGVGRSRTVHLDPDQSMRLINATSEAKAFRNLIIAALLTGARAPHELVDRLVCDFNAATGTLTIVDGKTGRRDITLTGETIQFLKEISKGRDPNALLFSKDDGTRWGKNHHTRPMRQAVRKANLPKGCTIYSLRHTHASQSILAGMNLKLLAENMGTSVRMLEQHYGHFIASSRRKLVEKSAFKLGLKSKAAAKTGRSSCLEERL